MADCDYCDRKADIPFKCKFCGGVFCSSHRLPESHGCLGLEGYKEKASGDLKVIYEPFQSDSSSEKESKRSSFPSFLSRITKNCYSLIIAISVVVFILQGLFFEYLNYFWLPLEVGKILQKPWTLITSVFLHANTWHLFVNMFVLFFFGKELEKKIGSKSFLKIYLLAGFVGGLGFLLAVSVMGAPQVDMGGMGASGAIFGVLGTLAMIAPEIKVFFMFIPVPIKIRHFLLVYAVFDIFLLRVGGMLGSAAHLFGLLVGAVYGYKILKNKGRNRRLGSLFRKF